MWVNDENAALLTDLYELTMAASYFSHGMNEVATFDLFVRSLPKDRNYLVACGLDDALRYLEHFAFDDGALDYLRSLEIFDERFLRFLRQLRFTGEVRAIPEGELVFAGEPLLSVTAPLIEAQMVETFLLNCTNFQTLIATKAARIAHACRDRVFVDFSPRRDHGADAAMKAARASYIGGAVATSNVLAGRAYGIPVSGTMAHSYVMAFDHELDAFRAFAADFGERTILLIDTYDVLQGARHAVEVAREYAQRGVRLRGVRLDSGDLEYFAREVRHILDEGGFPGMEIFASSDLDEFVIDRVVSAGVPVDAFGVGTQLGVSGDAPALGGVYKLVEYAGGGRVKLSPGKATLPGRKQVHRVESGGACQYDILSLEEEAVREGRPVMETVMVDGKCTRPPEPLDAIRERCRRACANLPASLQSLRAAPEPYQVRLSPGLEAERERAARAAG
ncbi:MAG: nicotinate phosphoribosyltransferase [Dehalococcoidia bacterium]